MTSKNQRSASFLRGVTWPLFSGVAATIGFYVLLNSGIINSPFLQRYTAGHPIEFVEVTMFFIGFMFLITRATALLRQFGQIKRVQLPAPTEIGPEEHQFLSDAMDQLPASAQQSMLGQRIQSAIDFVKRQSSASGLDEELKYLSDIDASRAHESYSLVRIIIWATPMLGFLGTVMGITLALGDLSPEALVNSPNEAMEGLLSGLSIAFDTTALALTLSIVLMFAQFLSQQIDTQLLSTVDDAAQHQLSHQFRIDSPESGDSAALEQISHRMVAATERLISEQSKTWQTVMQNTQNEWTSLASTTSKQLGDGLVEAVSTAASDHSSKMMQAEIEASERAGAYWTQVQKSIQDSAEQLRTQQAEMARQNELLLKVVEGSNQITRLEESLNQNLSALAGSKNFEDTVMSLSAAIHLLSSRLGRSLPKAERVALESKDEPRGHAA